MGEEQVFQNPSKKWYKTPVGILILLILWPFSLTYWIWKRNWNQQTRIGIIAGFWIFLAVIGATQNSYQAGFKEGKRAATTTSSPTLIILPSPTTLSTPTPTSEPTTNLQADPQEYLEYSTEMQSFFTDTNKANTELAELMGKYPYLTTEDVINLAKDTVILEMAHDRVSKILPPPELKSTHQKYIRAYKIIKDSMPILRDAFDNNDDTLFKQSTEKVIEASNLISQANDELNTFTKSLSK